MSLETLLDKRSSCRCELCSSELGLSVFNTKAEAASEQNSLMVCQVCKKQVLGESPLDVNHWRCLSESMWSEYSAIQVMAFRMLSKLESQPWARELLDQLFLDEDTLRWAKEGLSIDDHETVYIKPTKDSNGNILFEGDSVTLIKDLEVKGANFTAKRGTLVKNISLSSNPEHIEGRVNGTQIVLLTCFLKKVIL